MYVLTPWACGFQFELRVGGGGMHHWMLIGFLPISELCYSTYVQSTPLHAEYVAVA